LDDTIGSEHHCEVIVYSVIGHLNEDEITRGNFQEDGDFKGHLAITVARRCTF
jgi:hypothetical protein